MKFWRRRKKAYTWRCKRCTKYAETWDTMQAAQAASVWHVYNVHRNTWAKLVGDRPPLDPYPETFGRRLDEPEAS